MRIEHEKSLITGGDLWQLLQELGDPQKKRNPVENKKEGGPDITAHVKKENQW